MCEYTPTPPVDDEPSDNEVVSPSLYGYHTGEDPNTVGSETVAQSPGSDNSQFHQAE